MLTRKEVEKQEEKFFASYAAKSAASRGRLHKEKEHDYRTCYQRDRDRIIYSTAFRRLEYKTQVFVNHEGDYYRTRLTHTLEVTQIARTIARALRLNQELSEAIALAHDVGHTPFGHAGEDTLHDIMKDHGGFNHNLQGLRVVDMLEERYPGFLGLNLSYEVREGIAKHTSRYDKLSPKAPFPAGESLLLETQIVDAADEIAYDNHDLDDGITSGLIKEQDLKDIPLWREASAQIDKIKTPMNREIRKYQMIRFLINKQITDLVCETEKRLKKYRIKDIRDVRKCKKRAVAFSRPQEASRVPMKEFLADNLYKHYRVIRMSDKARRFMNQLFRIYLENTEQLPPTTKSRAKKEGPHRAICDYIAGMTDRYALDEYKKFFEPYERV